MRIRCRHIPNVTEPTVGYIEEKTLAVYQRLMKERRDDVTADEVEDVVFWPSLFALGGNGPVEHDFVQLKGEFEALRDNSIYKECQIDILIHGKIRNEEQAQQIRKIRAQRNRACPTRSTGRGICRLEWEINHPEKAAILKNDKDW